MASAQPILELILENGPSPGWLAALFAASVFLYVVYQRTLHPLAGIPGPAIASLTRLWLGRQFRKKSMHRVEMALHRRYGSVVRIAPTEVSVSSPQAMHLVYGASSRFMKSDWYICCGSRKEKGAFNLMGETDMAQYRAHRRLITPAFTAGAMRSLEDGMHETITVFTQAMVDRSAEQPIDVTLWTNILSIDLLTFSLFSERLGLLDAGEDDGSVAAMEAAAEYAHWSGLFPPLYMFNQWVVKHLGLHLFDRNLPYPAVPWCMSRISGRLDDPPGAHSCKDDILAKLLHIRAQNQQQLKREDAVAMALATLYAGFDTMGITLTAALYHIAGTPGCQTQLHAELDAALADGRVSMPPTVEELKQLPYLEACLAETLRVHPTTGTTLPRTVPQGGAEIDGFFLPAGTTVGISPWVLHRDKSIFGDDADTFRPQRWLDTSRDRVFEMKRYSLAFGGVTRSCPGKQLALTAMTLILARVFMQFSLVLDTKRETEEICMFSTHLNNVRCTFGERRRL